MAHLIILNGTPAPQKHELNGKAVTIGRAPDNTIVLEDASVSSHHAEITSSGEGWVLRDLQSSNGTKRNGQRFVEGELKDGDEVRFASVVCTFRDVRIASPEAGAVDGEEPYAPPSFYRFLCPPWVYWELGMAALLCAGLFVMGLRPGAIHETPVTQSSARIARPAAVPRMQRKVEVDPSALPLQERMGSSLETRSLVREMVTLALEPLSVPNAAEGSEPPYSETVSFIARKTIGGPYKHEIGYGRDSHLLIIRAIRQDGTPFQVCAVDPKALSPQVKVFKVNERTNGLMLEKGSVKIGCTNGKKEVLTYTAIAGVSRQLGNSIELECTDLGDAQQVAAAFEHLITIFGGKPDSF